MAHTISSSRLAELLAKARANALEASKMKATEPVILGHIEVNPESQELETITTLDKYGKEITYNAKQAEFVSLATSGKSSILIGAAGTGKTTCMRGVLEHLLSGNCPRISTTDHKHLHYNSPGIVVCAFTRRAVANIRRVVPEDMKANCITIHKLLEYAPVYYEVMDEETGKLKKTMSFEPTRHKHRPLDSNIRTIIVEEASMPSVELFCQILEALTHEVQFIFLGDIQQLPPVFGSAILGFKMLELPTVELTEVYRQALESPIIRLAHRILSGVPIPYTEFKDWKVPGQLNIREWTKKVSADIALLTAGKLFTSMIDAGQYNVDEDVILIPFNKAFGTDELNKHIAQHISRKNLSRTFEVIAGWNKHYFAIGDKILVDKEDAIITDIVPNLEYIGKTPKHPHIFLDRWGHFHKDLAGEEELVVESEFELEDIDNLLEKMAAHSDGEEDTERKRVASHIIKYHYANDEDKTIFEMTQAGEVNNTVLAYAITIHKSQGSEWRRVFLMLHQSHNTMLQRELLYTAITRAREELLIICEQDSLVKGIQSQKIKGNTLAEKAEYFKGKVENNEKQLSLLIKSKGTYNGN